MRGASMNGPSPMKLARVHRRLVVLMSLAGLLAFVGGAGVEPLSAVLATAGLVLAFFWQPSPALSDRLERAWLVLALILVVRALFHFFVIEDDIVIPVVDLLFLLLIAESLRSLEATNDIRIYSLSFALLLASTAYRPGFLFLLAFMSYVGLATVVLIFGHLRTQGKKHGTGDIPVPRSFLVTATGLSVVSLFIAASVFLTFPRVSQGWAGRGEVMATSLAGFADEVTLGSHGSRIFGNPQIVLRVEFPEGTPTNLQSSYWRGRSYDRFDGVRWSRSDRLPPSLVPPAWYAKWGSEVIPQKIYGAPLDTRVIFALHPLMEIEPESEIQPIPDNSGDYLYWGSVSPAYTAYSLAGRPSPTQLRSAQEGFVPARPYYTQLPSLSPEIRSLADSLLTDLPTGYEKALALEAWFQREFTYTLDLPRTAAEATLDHFLLSRRAGHCEYFSTAMAILLRTQGIPAREVNGFLGGTWSDFGDYLAVTQNQAHAWVEVWFPGYGWVPFDPTPAGGNRGSASTSWLWPGRFLFDAIQHRWNRWILDYSIETQFNILQRTRNALARTQARTPEEPGGDGRAHPFGILLWGVGGLFAIGLVFWASRLKTEKQQATRIFLSLRESCRRAGMPTYSLHSPLSLTRYLESIQHPATSAAGKVVNGYIWARFSGHVVQDEFEKDLLRALEDARALLAETSP